MQIKKATKQQVKLKLAVQGPSGSGKTLGAIALAMSLSHSKKVCVIDTEHGSASLYADRYAFDVIDLLPPYTSARYQEAIKAVSDAGYEALVIDSITHQWDGEGGILDRKAELDKRPGSNSYTNWQSFTPEHSRFLESILKAPLHVIVTMRSKSEYVLTTNERGKQQPKKVGMAPIQRDGVEFEFTTVFDVQLDHKAAAIKDRTSLFNDRIVDLLDPMVGAELLAWLNSGVAIPAAIIGGAEAKDGHFTNRCERCSEPIEAAEIDGKQYTIGQITAVSKARHDGKMFCVSCLAALKEESAKGVPVNFDSDPMDEPFDEKPASKIHFYEKDGKSIAAGTVTAVFHQQAKKPFSFQLEDELLFSTFSKSTAAILKDARGKSVTFSYEKKGSFYNLVELLTVDGMGASDLYETEATA